MKTCTKCARDAADSGFYRDAKAKDGRQSRCKKCMDAARKSRYQKNRKAEIGQAKVRRNNERRRELRLQNRDYINALQRKWIRSHPLEQLLINARQRAGKKGLCFALTKNDIFPPLRCPLLDILLVWGGDKCVAGSPTLDRIDNNKGYVPGNVWIVSHRANTLKGAGSLVELTRLVNKLQEASAIAR